MRTGTLYLKIEQNVEVTNKTVYLEDVAKIYSTDKNIEKKLNKVVVIIIKAKENTKYMISVMKIIEIISKEYPEIEIVNLGEADFILDYKLPGKANKVWEYAKAFIVGIIIFIGSAFTIMTFNTDVSVSEIFDNTYQLITGHPKTGGSVLEIAYSIGLPIGIIIFFDHFSRAKIHNDPTPIEVQMRSYEEDVNKALIQDASREGKTIDSN